MARTTTKNSTKTARQDPNNERGPDYTIDDLQSDAGHLYHLLDIVVTELMGPLEGEDRHRVNAVAWVARDLAELLKQKLDDGVVRPDARISNAA